jgi:FixJ family two-component response regulator
MLTKRKVIAVIDDNFAVLGAMSRLLTKLGYDTELYVSAQELLDAARNTEANCLIVDIQLGDSCGIELAQRLADDGFTIPVIFMTANNSELVRARVLAMGCVAFLIKPFTADTLVEALASLTRRKLN